MSFESRVETGGVRSQVSQRNPASTEAEAKVRAFGDRFGQAHVWFACHAAMPLALTPDLLYGIWATFQDLEAGFLTQAPASASWIAVADLLMSDLCREVGHELYAMDADVRELLLQLLGAEPRFGAERLRAVADLILRQTEGALRSQDEELRDWGQVQRWTALAYVQPELAARELAQGFAQQGASSLEEAGMGQETEGFEAVRLARVVQQLAVPLEQGSYQQLVSYARGMEAWLLGDRTGAVEGFGQLPEGAQDVRVAEMVLVVPKVGKRRVGDTIATVEPPVFVSARFQALRTESFSFEMVMVSPRGRIISRSVRQMQELKEELSDQVILEMVAIPGGEFLRGMQKTQLERGHDKAPQKTVTIFRFMIGKYPVTQMQYKAVMGKNPSNFEGEDRPVESVSWNDATEFCQKLSKQTGREYRLPSEMEWEYACRAGTTTSFHFGETITPDLANYWSEVAYGKGSTANPQGGTSSVGSFKVANAFGLYDMHGNVWEWCQDAWHSDYDDALNHGSAWSRNNKRSHLRTLRGGSWNDIPRNCCSAIRIGSSPINRGSGLGFRVALSARA